MARTRKSFIKLKQNSSGDTIGLIDQQITGLEKMIDTTRTALAQQGSDLFIAFENPPGVVAIKPRDELELEFSLNNLGKTLSNPATVHYQFISSNGNVYDSDVSNGFDKIDPRHKTVFWDVDLTVPENIVGGNYQIRASLEFQKNMADKDELNNHVASDYLFVYSEPDIKITDFSHRVKKILNDSSVVATQLTWENQGGNPATNNRLLLFLENVDDADDITLLQEDKVKDVPAISETVVMSHKLNIPQIDSDNKYKLVAEIKSEGELKENAVINNRFESSELIGRNIEPITITGLNLNTRISYPGKKVNLEIRLRNNQPKQPINDVEIELSLKSDKGETCCAVIKKVQTVPPSISIKDSEGNVDVTDTIFKTNIMFPGISRGQYLVEARLISTSDIEVIEDPKLMQSNTKLYYGNPTFRITNSYPIRDIMIPGKDTQFNVTVLNNGKNKSQPEKLGLYLEGKRSTLIGTINIEGLAPSGQSVTLRKSIKMPRSLSLGSYTLVLRKEESTQSSTQVLRYRNAVTVQDIQPIAPQEFESFKQNEVPLFSWNSIDNLSYRLAFSTDPGFTDNSKIFRIPDNTWLKHKQYQPQIGEWKIIWLLSQRLKRDVFWKVEARSAQNKIIRGIPQKILLKQETFN